MKYEIKKIDIWTTARFVGIFYTLIGIIPMLMGFFSFFTHANKQVIYSLAFLLFPLGAFAAGFVIGFVFALIYNAVAKEVGGIKMDINYNQNEN